LVTVNQRKKSSHDIKGFDFQTWLEHIKESRSSAEIKLLKDVYMLMSGVVEHQQHIFGESELVRALLTAEILADLHVDTDSLLAVMLYGVLQVSAIHMADIESHYGDNVAQLVRSVQKMQLIDSYHIHDLESYNDKQHLEGVRKLLLALAEDVRVVLIKLAERVHIMRILGRVSEEIRRQIATETREIFAPLASRLGVWQLKWELEDLAFRYLEPQAYMQVANSLDGRRIDREKYIKNVTKIIKSELEKVGIHAEVSGRPKHIYSIWRKMQKKAVGFDSVYDVRATRVLVNNIAECYTALGVVHNCWRPIKSEFDDYIASPKGNNYQSLHTAVIGPEDKIVEVQIRTHDMHYYCEYGVAAHWGYKEGGKQDTKYTEQISVLRQILELNETGEESGDFLDRIKSEIFEDRVYTLTPNGKVIDLPRGATPLDFAYHIHTDVGNHYRGAKVDGKIVTLGYQLKNGQKVEILTSKHSSPSRDWLNPHLGFTTSSRTRSKVRSWFKKLDYDKNVEAGHSLLDREFGRLGVHGQNHEALATRFKQKKLEDFYAAVGSSDISAAQIANAVQEIILPKKSDLRKPMEVSSRQQKSAETSGLDNIQIMGVGNLMAHMARCCKPIPYDAITGFITRGRGVTVHKRDCSNLLRLAAKEGNRLIEVAWGKAGTSTYPANIYVSAFDRQGLLNDITQILTNSHLNVVAVSTQTDKTSYSAEMNFSVEVTDVGQLSRALIKIEQLPNVYQVTRKSN